MDGGDGGDKVTTTLTDRSEGTEGQGERTGELLSSGKLKSPKYHYEKTFEGLSHIDTSGSTYRKTNSGALRHFLSENRLCIHGFHFFLHSLGKEVMDSLPSIVSNWFG